MYDRDSKLYVFKNSEDHYNVYSLGKNEIELVSSIRLPERPGFTWESECIRGKLILAVDRPKVTNSVPVAKFRQPNVMFLTMLSLRTLPKTHKQYFPFPKTHGLESDQPNSHGQNGTTRNAQGQRCTSDLEGESETRVSTRAVKLPL